MKTLINWYVSNGKVICGDTKKKTGPYKFIQESIVFYNAKKDLVVTLEGNVYAISEQHMDRFFAKKAADQYASLKKFTSLANQEKAKSCVELKKERKAQVDEN